MDGWWLYKYYRPEVPEEATLWPARQTQLRALLLGPAHLADVPTPAGQSVFSPLTRILVIDWMSFSLAEPLPHHWSKARSVCVLLQ